MNTSQKPFEILNETEKKIIMVCSDIIRCLPDTSIEGVMDLRKRAMALFGMLQTVDLSADSDQNYQVLRAFADLDNRYRERIQNLTREWKGAPRHILPFRLENDLNTLIETVEISLERGISVELERNELENIPSYRHLPDTLRISTIPKGDQVKLYTFERVGLQFGNYHLNDDLIDSLIEKFKVKIIGRQHEHENGTHEFSITLREFPFDQWKPILKLMLEHAASNPRITHEEVRKARLKKIHDTPGGSEEYWEKMKEKDKERDKLREGYFSWF